MASHALAKKTASKASDVDPRTALLNAVLAFDNETVATLLSKDTLEALRGVVGEDATDAELRAALLTQDGTTTSVLMTACNVGNLEAVRNR